GARRSLLIGVGAAGLVATDLRDKLYRLRKDVVAATDRHAALTGAAMLTAQDVALGISHSGETEDVVGPLALARETGATTIALTNYRESAVAKQARIVILTAVADSSIRSRGMASRAAMMTLIDCLFIGVVQTNYDASLEVLGATSRAIERSGATRRLRSQ
ncbi:MAG TPA: MurR/RpiR family transcriptional regulator, partial [Candidatus Limnocylindrales bacterium]|nr:MurR/RpiR family transcriptional regulator [Candidatus Limnocylindrales bacterium]